MSEMCEVIKKIEDVAKQDIERMAAKGYDHIDPKAFGDSVDILKDAMEMKCFEKSILKECLEIEYMKNIKIPNKIREGELTERMLEEYDSDPGYGVMGNNRYGYNHYRYKNGRFAPKGRGRRMGYEPPYMHMMTEDDDWYGGMYDEMPYEYSGYRMGYSGGRGNSNGNSDGRSMNSGNSGRSHAGNSSRYGESYDRYQNNKKYYTENPTPEYEKMMKQSADEVFDDIESLAKKMFEDANPTDKAKFKTKMTQLVQKMQ